MLMDMSGQFPKLHDNLLRPANYPEGNAGVGLHVGETAAGIKVATINLEGRVFMKNLDSPFKVADQLLADLPDDVKVIFVDFHAEATSEKQALGFYLDGRVSAVVGTVRSGVEGAATLCSPAARCGAAP